MAIANRLQVDDFAYRLTDAIESIDCRPARSLDDREAIFRLRYDAYLREGAIKPNASKLFKDRYDDLPNVTIFGLYVNGDLASSIRVHVASPTMPVAPATAVFPDLLSSAIDTGKVVVDPTRFVAHHHFSRDVPGLPYATVRMGFLACDHFNADIGLATVRQEHRAFYRRLYFMRQMSEPRTYPGLEKPIIMMGIEYPEVREKIVERHPFLASTLAERTKLYGPAPARVLPRLLRSPGRPWPVAPNRVVNRPFRIHAA